MKTLRALVALTVLLASSLAPAHAQEQWLPRTSGVTTALWGVAHGGGSTPQWVAVREQGPVVTSPNAFN